MTAGRTILLALAMLAWAGPAHTGQVPNRVQISYTISVGPLRIGVGRDVLEHDGKVYRVVSTAETAGVAGALYPLHVVRQSTGRITPQGLRPDSFEEQRDGKLKRRVRFDWNANLAVLFDGKVERTVPLPPNTWDETSFGYNFAFASQPPAAQQVNLTDGRRIKLYTYTTVGDQRISTALGMTDTIHVRKVNPPGDNSEFDTWIAPGYFGLPVKTRIRERGGTVFVWELSTLQH
jgi:hypothetical protein